MIRSLDEAACDLLYIIRLRSYVHYSRSQYLITVTLCNVTGSDRWLCFAKVTH